MGSTRTRPEPVIRARVFRAKTGKWEDLGIIGTAQEIDQKLTNKPGGFKQWLQYLLTWVKRKFQIS